MAKGVSYWWPGWRDDHPRERQLVLLDNHELIGLHLHATVQDWAELKAALLEHHLECYTTDEQRSWWLLDALHDKGVEYFVPTDTILAQTSELRSFRVHGKNGQTASISSPTLWGVLQPDLAFLAALEYLFVLCGVGVRSSPASLGQAMMRRHWQMANGGQGRSWVARPLLSCQQAMLEHSIGGRVDYFVSKEEKFAQVFQLDLNSAYISVCDHLPDGKQVVLHGEPALGTPTWFMECTVVIPPETKPLPFGIFAVRGEDGHNRYPTHPERYESVWLWREEAELCRRNGWVVIPRRGWGWTRWNTGLAGWASKLYALRVQATELDNHFSRIWMEGHPTRRDYLLGEWVKQAMVASIGRFGMPLWSWEVKREDRTEPQDGDRSLMDGDEQTGLLLRRVDDLHNNHLTHWYSYILMRCRLTLRARMLWEQRHGNRVLGSNYDALWLLLPADRAEIGTQLGEWKEQRLTNVQFPAPRAIVCDQFRKLPGVAQA